MIIYSSNNTNLTTNLSSIPKDLDEIFKKIQNITPKQRFLLTKEGKFLIEAIEKINKNKSIIHTFSSARENLSVEELENMIRLNNGKATDATNQYTKNRFQQDEFRPMFQNLNTILPPSFKTTEAKKSKEAQEAIKKFIENTVPEEYKEQLRSQLSEWPELQKNQEQTKVYSVDELHQMFYKEKEKEKKQQNLKYKNKKSKHKK